MTNKISKRLLDIVDALPLKNGCRILEIGCGPGVAAKEIVTRFENVYVLAIDRSAKAIEQAEKTSQKEIKAGKLKFLRSPVESFELSLKKNGKLFINGGTPLKVITQS